MSSPSLHLTSPATASSIPSTSTSTSTSTPSVVITTDAEAREYYNKNVFSPKEKLPSYLSSYQPQELDWSTIGKSPLEVYQIVNDPSKRILYPEYKSVPHDVIERILLGLQYLPICSDCGVAEHLAWFAYAPTHYLSLYFLRPEFTTPGSDMFNNMINILLQRNEHRLCILFCAKEGPSSSQRQIYGYRRVLSDLIYKERFDEFKVILETFSRSEFTDRILNVFPFRACCCKSGHLDQIKSIIDSMPIRLFSDESFMYHLCEAMIRSYMLFCDHQRNSECGNHPDLYGIRVLFEWFRKNNYMPVNDIEWLPVHVFNRLHTERERKSYNEISQVHLSVFGSPFPPLPTKVITPWLNTE